MFNSTDAFLIAEPSLLSRSDFVGREYNYVILFKHMGVVTVKKRDTHELDIQWVSFFFPDLSIKSIFFSTY